MRVSFGWNEVVIWAKWSPHSNEMTRSKRWNESPQPPKGKYIEWSRTFNVQRWTDTFQELRLWRTSTRWKLLLPCGNRSGLVLGLMWRWMENNVIFFHAWKLWINDVGLIYVYYNAEFWIFFGKYCVRTQKNVYLCIGFEKILYFSW